MENFGLNLEEYFGYLLSISRELLFLEML